VEPGEAIRDAALREAQEESGLSFKKPLVDLKAEFQFESRGALVTEHAFALETDQPESDVRLDPHEHDEYRWLGESEALGLTRFESNREILEKLVSLLATDQKGDREYHGTKSNH
jgi:8-oxo-dGTP pyrophosphatase MutT (NUDIX family)